MKNANRESINTYYRERRKHFKDRAYSLYPQQCAKCLVTDKDLKLRPLEEYRTFYQVVRSNLITLHTLIINDLQIRSFFNLLCPTCRYQKRPKLSFEEKQLRIKSIKPDLTDDQINKILKDLQYEIATKGL